MVPKLPQKTAKLPRQEIGTEKKTNKYRKYIIYF